MYIVHPQAIALKTVLLCRVKAHIEKILSTSIIGMKLAYSTLLNEVLYSNFPALFDIISGELLGSLVECEPGRRALHQ